MRCSIGLTLLMCSLLAAAGCATYRAYPGPQRPRDEIALLTVVATDVHVDGEPVSPKGYPACIRSNGPTGIRTGTVRQSHWRSRQRRGNGTGSVSGSLPSRIRLARSAR
jgi:hypothetical protein